MLHPTTHCRWPPRSSTPLGAENFPRTLGRGLPNAVLPNVKQLDHARKTARQRIFPTTRIAGENAQDFLREDGTPASHNDIGTVKLRPTVAVRLRSA